MYFDKNGIEIKEGQEILLSNSRKDFEEKAIVESVDGELKYRLLEGRQQGKIGSIKNRVNCIYWPNDKPENVITVIKPYWTFQVLYAIGQAGDKNRWIN